MSAAAPMSASPPDLAAWEAALRSRVDAARAEHCVRTAAMCAVLAPVWGVDPAKARLAGLLHDWARGLTAAQTLEAAAALGLSVDPVARARPRALLHARVGAAQLEREGVRDQAVLSAVARHTVGAARLTPLEALVYVADYCEPGRTHEGSSEVRRLAFTNPAAALRRCVAGTVEHLLTRGQAVAAETIALWNGLALGDPQGGGA
jgi:predicted HD superfamily hydrolase involved in NAD metabolism